MEHIKLQVNKGYKMNYDLHGIQEIVATIIIFSAIIVGWQLAGKRDMSDDTRMFR